MPYVRDGAVVSRRSPYRLSIITDIFWSVVNLVAALCVPAHQISHAPSSSARALRLVALTPVSLSPSPSRRARRATEIASNPCWTRSTRSRTARSSGKNAGAGSAARPAVAWEEAGGGRRGAEAEEAAPAETYTVLLASAGSTTAPLKWAAEAGKRLPRGRVIGGLNLR